jgi:hypothetical protein
LSLLEFAAVYFSARPVLLVLASLYAAIAALFLVFRANAERPMVRSKILPLVFALASSSWIFVASSLVFCRAFESLYDSNQAAAITTVLGDGLLATLCSSPRSFRPSSSGGSRRSPSGPARRPRGSWKGWLAP